RNGGVPYIYAVEKRYAVCSKIVETFFDPAFNSKIPVFDISDPEKRQNESQFFYSTRSPFIVEFAEAYRLKSPVAVIANAQKWIQELASLGYVEQSNKIAGVLTNLEEEIS